MADDKRIDININADIDKTLEEVRRAREQQEALQREIDELRKSAPDVKGYMQKHGIDQKKAEALRRERIAFEQSLVKTTEPFKREQEFSQITQKFEQYRYNLENFVRQYVMASDQIYNDAVKAISEKYTQIEAVQRQLVSASKNLSELQKQQKMIEGMNDLEYDQWLARKDNEAKRAALEARNAVPSKRDEAIAQRAAQKSNQSKAFTYAPTPAQAQKRRKEIEDAIRRQKEAKGPSTYERIKNQKNYDWDYVETVLDTSFDSTGQQKHEYRFGSDEKTKALLANAKKISTTTAISQARSGGVKAATPPGFPAKMGTALHRILEILPDNSEAALQTLEKALIENKALDEETRQIVAQVVNEHNPLVRKAQIKKMTEWARKYRAMEKAAGAGDATEVEVPLGLTTSFTDKNGNLRRLAIGGSVDRIEAMRGGERAIVDHKSGAIQPGMEQAAQQILYRVMANKAGKNVSKMFLDWVPYSDRANFQGGVRYEVTGVTPEVEEFIENAVLKGAYNDERQGVPIDIAGTLEAMGVKLVPVGQKTVKGLNGKDISVSSPVVSRKNFFNGLTFSQKQERDYEYRDAEAIFWQDYGPLLSKMVKGTASKEEQAKFAEGYGFLRELAGDRNVGSDWLNKNRTVLDAAVRGDKDALKKLSSLPNVEEISGLQIDGQWVSSFLKSDKGMEQLYAKIQAASAEDRASILNSLFGHMRIPGGERIGKAPLTEDNYRTFAKADQNKRAAELRSRLLAEGLYAPVGSAEEARRATVEYKENFNPDISSEEGDISGLAINGHWLGEYISRIKDIKSRLKPGENLLDNPEVKQIIEFIKQVANAQIYDENGDINGNQAYVGQNLLTKFRQRLIDDVGLSELKNLPFEGEEAVLYHREMSGEGNVSRDRNPERENNVVAEREARTEDLGSKSIDEMAAGVEETPQFQRALRDNTSSVEEQSLQVGHRMARLMDFAQSIEEFYRPITEQINAQRSPGVPEFTTEQIARHHLATFSPGNYERYMRSKELNALMAAKEAELGRGMTDEERFAFLEGKLGGNAEEESLLGQIGNVREQDSSGVLMKAALATFANRTEREGTGLYQMASAAHNLAENKPFGREDYVSDENLEKQRQEDVVGFHLNEEQKRQIAEESAILPDSHEGVERFYSVLKKRATQSLSNQYSDKAIEGYVDQLKADELMQVLAGRSFEELDLAEATTRDKKTGKRVFTKEAEKDLDSYYGEYMKQRLEEGISDEELDQMEKDWEWAKQQYLNRGKYNKELKKAVKNTAKTIQKKGEAKSGAESSIEDLVEAQSAEIRWMDAELDKAVSSRIDEIKADASKIRKIYGQDGVSDRSQEDAYKARKEAHDKIVALTGQEPIIKGSDGEEHNLSGQRRYKLSELEAEEERKRQEMYARNEISDVPVIASGTTTPEALAQQAEKAEQDNIAAKKNETLLLTEHAESLQQAEKAEQANTAATQTATKAKKTTTATRKRRKVGSTAGGATGAVGTTPVSSSTNVTNTQNITNNKNTIMNGVNVSGDINIEAGPVNLNITGETTIINQVSGGGGNPTPPAPPSPPAGTGGGTTPPPPPSGGSGGSGYSGGRGGYRGGGSRYYPTDNENYREAIQLLTRQLQLKREIAQVDNSLANLSERRKAGDSESLKIQEDELKVLRQEYQDQSKDLGNEIQTRLNNLSPAKLAEYTTAAATKTTIADQRIAVDAKENTSDEADQLAKEYERSLRERLQIESKIDQLTQRRNTTLSRREVEATDLAIAAQQKKLALVQQEGEQIKRNSNLRKADAKRIEQDYAVERAAQKAQNESANHGSRNVWDMLGYDIKRSFAMIFDFGLAHRAINSIQMKFRELITTIQELDKAMTNIRIVTGQTSEQTSDLMKTYNDLASELGTTTLAIAEASNEWLN